MRKSTRKERRHEVVGDLATLALAEIAQTLSLGAKTARVTLTNGHRTGRVWFTKGEPRHAEVGHQSGERAFFVMLAWKRGQFVIEHGIRTPHRSLPDDAMYLVLEGMRRIDESSVEPDGEVDTDLPLPSQPKRVRYLLIPLALALGALWWAQFGPLALPTSWSELIPEPTLPAPSPPAMPSQAPVVHDRPAPFLNRDLSDVPWNWEDVLELPPAADPEPAVAASRPLADGALAEAVALFDAYEATGNNLAGPLAGAESELLAAQELVVESAWLSLIARSNVKSGRLTILVDGTEVFDVILTREKKGAKRFFGRMVGKGAERIEELIRIAPGEREIEARLEVDKNSRVYESNVSVSFEAGATRSVNLFAGRAFGPPLSLELE